MACDTSPNPPEVEALFPGNVVPQVRMEQLSAIRSVGYTPLILSGALIQVLRQHFCDAQNIMNHRLRAYLLREGAWSAGTESGLYIESLARWRPELTEMRPAIVVKEGNWVWRHKVVGDIADTNWEQGIIAHFGLWEGTHTIFALGGEGAETQILAAELAKMLVYFGRGLADSLCLHRFQLVQVGALSALKESTENYVVPVTVAYVAEETWNLQLEGPRLKSFDLATTELV